MNRKEGAQLPPTPVAEPKATTKVRAAEEKEDRKIFASPQHPENLPEMAPSTTSDLHTTEEDEELDDFTWLMKLAQKKT